MSKLSQRVARSPFARLAALPMRVMIVGRRNAAVLRASVRWLVSSKEHTNITYELTPLNKSHLAWWVANVSHIPVAEARKFIEEVENDQDLLGHVRDLTRQSDRRRLADDTVLLHKRVGWYALVRALQPHHIVETGTDKGLGSVVLAAALIRNGSGTLTTVDVNPTSGYLIGEPYSRVITRVVGDSVTKLRELESPVDLFLHDSLHTREHEIAELDAVSEMLSSGAAVVSDNSHVTDALPTWAESNGFSFFYFQEMPSDHWYPGGGIGLAFTSGT
jgi:hypothetical protein